MMYKGKKVIHIVASGIDGEIGADNKLLWNIPEDMKFFRDSTLGHVCLVGRKTAESFPNKLTRRCIVEVTRKPCGFGGQHTNRNLRLKDHLDNAVEFTNCVNTDSIFIIGGQKLYESTFDIADEIWRTEVINVYPHADRFYNIPNDFMLKEQGELLTSVSGIDYRFEKYVKEG